jgi:hypothetical protein
VLRNSSRSPSQTTPGTPKQHALGGSTSRSVHSLCTRLPSSTCNNPSYAKRPVPHSTQLCGLAVLVPPVVTSPAPRLIPQHPQAALSITNHHTPHAAPHLRKTAHPHPNPPTRPRRRSCRNKAHRPEGAPACSHGCSERVLERAQPVDNEQPTPRPGRAGGISITTHTPPTPPRGRRCRRKGHRPFFWHVDRPPHRNTTHPPTPQLCASHEPTQPTSPGVGSGCKVTAKKNCKTEHYLAIHDERYSCHRPVSSPNTNI